MIALPRLAAAAQLATAALLVALPLSAAGTAIDSEKPLICAAIELMSCEPGDRCRSETVESLNAPQFLSIDVPGRKVSGARPQSSNLSVAIHNVRALGEDIVLDGMEANLAWNIAIARQTGDMTLTGIRTLVDDPLVIVIFGACTNR
jgi:hypothetical protein